jgi:deoxycytidine triphosphate deaminase
MADPPDRRSTEAGFPATDNDARERFARYRAVDPFPEIPPALLNSADISDYIRVTGMIFPFHPEDLAKPACYQGRIGGWASYDETARTMIVRELEADELVTLAPNAIAYVVLEPTLRLPEYLALRFNLTIANVHRGLLVGTGPLVDPGFEGKLLIPLHNLTTNEYAFRGREGLVWFEFSKLSPLSRWQRTTREQTLGRSMLSKLSPLSRQLSKSGETRQGRYVDFPDAKKISSPAAYLQRAHPSGVVRSSIPGAIADARDSAANSEVSAKEAAAEARGARSHLQRVAWGAVLAILIAAAGLGYTFYSILQNDRALVQQLQVDRQALTDSVEVLMDRIEELTERQERLEEGISELSG